MTPTRAIEILDKVGAAYVGRREEHVQIQLAISVLRGLVDRAATEAQPLKEKAEASAPANQTPARDRKDSGGDKAKSKTG
jgi:hypothetical protein